jgi:anti-anti-sigma factor
LPVIEARTETATVTGEALQRPLDEVLGQGAEMQDAARRALARSAELTARATATRRTAVLVRLGSRRRRHYARLWGDVGGRAVAVVVRADGSISGDLSVERRVRGGRTETPQPQAQRAPLLQTPPARAADVGRPDPLWQTVLAARAVDRLAGIDLVRASARGGLGALRASASAAPSEHASGSPESGGGRRRPVGADAYLSLDVVDDGEGTHFVVLHGELDLAQAERVHDVLLETAGSTVVDLTDLAFLDAAGLSALLRARRQITAAGHRLVIRGAHGLVRRVFEITHVAHLLED